MKVGHINIKLLISYHDDVVRVIDENGLDVFAVPETWLNVNFLSSVSVSQSIKSVAKIKRQEMVEYDSAFVKASSGR